MARKFTSTDFKEHESTYQGFMALTKWSIIAMIFVVLALYCFIVAEQPILGWLLLALSVVVPVAKAITSASKS